MEVIIYIKKRFPSRNNDATRVEMFTYQNINNRFCYILGGSHYWPRVDEYSYALKISVVRIDSLYISE